MKKIGLIYLALLLATLGWTTYHQSQALMEYAHLATERDEVNTYLMTQNQGHRGWVFEME